jgi:hypothetical protein
VFSLALSNPVGEEARFSDDASEFCASALAMSAALVSDFKSIGCWV